MPRKPLKYKINRIKSWIRWILGIYEFKVDCACGNKIRMTDGVKQYNYDCIKCGKTHKGTKKRLFR